VFGELCKFFENVDIELLATNAQRIWLYRNDVVYKRDLMHPAYLVKSAMEPTEAYSAVEQGRKNKGERRQDNVIP
jgi:hypothetical protein